MKDFLIIEKNLKNEVAVYLCRAVYCSFTRRFFILAFQLSLVNRAQRANSVKHFHATRSLRL